MTKQERDEKKRQRQEEHSKLRKRLVKIIDNPSTSDHDALSAINMLWQLDEATRGYH